MKRYKTQFQETTLTINNVNSALLAITEGIDFIYSKLGPELKADKLVASGIFNGLKNIEDVDVKSSMMMINKYVREYANKQFLGREE